MAYPNGQAGLGFVVFCGGREALHRLLEPGNPSGGPVLEQILQCGPAWGSPPKERVE